MNTAEINPPPTSRAIRNVERIKRLRLAIERTESEDRKSSLQAELDRRLSEAEALKAALADI